VSIGEVAESLVGSAGPPGIGCHQNEHAKSAYGENLPKREVAMKNLSFPNGKLIVAIHFRCMHRQLPIDRR
jgi:hypothetical protein